MGNAASVPQATHNTSYDSNATVLSKELGVSPRCQFTEFANAVENARQSLRAAPVTAVVSYKIIDPNDQLLRNTLWLFSHQFVVMSIHLKDGPTFIRIDHGPDGQYVSFANSWDALQAGAAELGRLSKERQSVHTGPSLDALASLLRIVHARTHGYDVFSRNCFWMTETILFSMARKYSDHWLNGRTSPDALQRYARGQLDALTCATDLSIWHPVGRAIGRTFFGVTRASQSFFTASVPDRLVPQDAEIDCVLSNWHGGITASL
ncbi:hypothetical protein WOLCODRAFT_75634 [Wolfiporia cocos MD-104 SS10]|uniref:PPPDE domain-containing protein n=1 Tax=Wolfiporia cocos (strain MD-104) TaxID=742152 RepID=A0A2H3JQ19_WOLCO|nr:hypothetical protein WOLCODRAFT_75634 [Wolfiporia cocos MD-104 SS10]